MIFVETPIIVSSLNFTEVRIAETHRKINFASRPL